VIHSHSLYTPTHTPDETKWCGVCVACLWTPRVLYAYASIHRIHGIVCVHTRHCLCVATWPHTNTPIRIYVQICIFNMCLCVCMCQSVNTPTHAHSQTNTCIHVQVLRRIVRRGEGDAHPPWADLLTKEIGRVESGIYRAGVSWLVIHVALKVCVYVLVCVCLGLSSKLPSKSNSVFECVSVLSCLRVSPTLPSMSVFMS